MPNAAAALSISRSSVKVIEGRDTPRGVRASGDGETLVVELWQDGGTISYRASVKERPGTVVLNNGLCLLA